MTIAKIISAIGNNNSIYPLLVRDCGIEIPTKVVLTYNQNEKQDKNIAYLAARERLIDEYAVSAVWLGGIPLVDKIAKKIIARRGFNSDVNMKLFKDDGYQGIERNFKEFKGKVAPEILDDLSKVKAKSGLFQKYIAGKFTAATLIPIVLMGWVIPKLIFASTAKKLEEARRKTAQIENAKKADKTKPSFGSSNIVAAIANCSPQTKMIFVDGGYAVGRGATARNRDAFWDTEFKMAGMLFLNFVAPKWIAKGLDGITGTNIDPIILADGAFREQIKNGKLELPKSASAEDLFKFIDNNPDSLFVTYAKKFNKVKMIKGIEREVRDPRAWVDVKDLGKFRDAIAIFADSTSGKDVAQALKKAKGLKYFNVLTNVVVSSILLAYGLPKAQFAFREKFLGTKLEPGIEGDRKRISNQA